MTVTGPQRGTVENYNERAGYGYIVPDEPLPNDAHLLVHRNSVRDVTVTLQKGDRVCFSVATVPRGLLATDVHPALTDDEVESGNVDVDELALERLQDLSEARNADHAPSEDASDYNPPSEPSTPPSELTARDLAAQASLAREEKRFEDAARLYERAVELGPTLQIILSYAALQKEGHRKKDAMQTYERGMAFFPESAKLREDAGVLAAAIGDYRKALAYLKEALRLCRELNQAGEKGVLLALARTSFKMDTQSSLIEAIKSYESAVALFDRGRFPQKDLLWLGLAQLRTQHHRGNLTAKFFANAGFTILRSKLLPQATFGADLIVRTNETELTESYGLSGNVLVRCMFKSEVSHADLEDLDKRAGDLGNDGLIDDQVVLLIVSSISEDLQRVLYKRIETNQIAFVPISQSHIETLGGLVALLWSGRDLQVGHRHRTVTWRGFAFWWKAGWQVHRFETNRSDNVRGAWEC